MNKKFQNYKTKMTNKKKTCTTPVNNEHAYMKYKINVLFL